VDREGRKNKFPHLHAPHDHVFADVCESSGRTVGKKIDRLNSVHGPSLKPDGFRGKEFPCLRASRWRRDRVTCRVFPCDNNRENPLKSSHRVQARTEVLPRTIPLTISRSTTVVARGLVWISRTRKNFCV